MSKFLLLLGPSGVGKSVIIDELCRLDSRFSYISPYMTRPLREGERNKISISNKEMDKRLKRGEFLVINELYGIRYATPRLPIVQAFSKERFPLLDWPIDKIKVILEEFPEKLYSVYVAPPSIEILIQRLSKDNRDISGNRLKSACRELKAYWSQKYIGTYNLSVISEENQLSNIVSLIYENYLKSFDF